MKKRLRAPRTHGGGIVRLAAPASCWLMGSLLGCGGPAETEVEAPPITTLVEQTEASGPVPSTPDPSALAELLAQVPKSDVAPTAPDGTLVGSDTGRPADEGSVEEAPAKTPPDPAAVRAGTAEFQPALSSPAIERAARAQLYWRLRECRQSSGEPPPPESITLGFTIRQDGSVDPASVTATADDDALAEVAVCVLRTFSASPFLGPPAGLDTSSRVLITWPSVD